MKKLISLLLCLLLLCPVMTVFAENPKIIDDAGLLWSDEIAALEEKYLWDLWDNTYQNA